MRVQSTSSSLSAPVSGSGSVQQQQPAQKEGAQKAQESQQTAKQSDSLEISKTSEQMNKTAAPQQESSFRADKVAQVKQSIESNQYKVDSRAVAEKMLFAFSRGPTA
jgi:flagellar biosynthesis anti-sigma factor FlgM